jgi:hypothetical protein
MISSSASDTFRKTSYPNMNAEEVITFHISEKLFIAYIDF